MTDHVRHPAPLNQFYKLDYDDVAHRWVKTTTQWPGSFNSVNCMATAGAVAIDAHTGGVIRSNPPQIRAGQDDQSGGIGVNDVDVAWHRLWGRDLLTPAGFSWADVMHAVKTERRHVAIGVDYAKVPYAYQLQKGGTFDHALNIDDIRDTDGAILRYDSLGTNPAWVPQSAVRPAAEALALRARGTAGSLFVGLTASRPAVGTAAPHYHATVIHATKLWNDSTKRWVYQLAVGATLIVRGAKYVKGGKSCYPIVAGTQYGGYWAPAASVKLGGIAP